MSDNREAKMCTPYPHVDWKETRDAHVFNIDLPGVEKEAVALGMAEGRILEISGELSKEEEKQDGEKYHRTEVLKGSFNRRFKLPEDAKVDEAKATMENGVLTVIVPKWLDYQPPPKFREVEISD